MSLPEQSFPLWRDAWRGVILATIAQAIWSMPDRDNKTPSGWDGPTYHLNDGSGGRAALTFAEGRVVGVFYDEDSSRSPYQTTRPYNAEDYFAGAPNEILALARRTALRYVFDDYAGRAQPVITAACWDVDDRLSAAEPWPLVYENGAHLLRIHLLETEEAIAEWANEYLLSDAQVALLRQLHARKVTTAGRDMTVTPEEWRALTAEGDDGAEESCHLLAAVGIICP